MQSLTIKYLLSQLIMQVIIQHLWITYPRTSARGSKTQVMYPRVSLILGFKNFALFLLTFLVLLMLFSSQSRVCYSRLGSTHIMI